MATRRQPLLKKGDVVVMVGTVKGAFLLKATRGRRSWERLGPFFRGEAVYAMALDQRSGRPRLFAGPESSHWGATLHYSDTLGKTWNKPESAPIRFPEPTGATLKRIWQIAPGRAGEPNVMYCGVEPAALFESHDSGASWSLVDGLWNHPHRPQWQPGGGGMCLHTVIPDPTQPRRLFVAVSTAGVYRSDDAGRTWRTAHKGVRAQFLPDKYPEFGQCVHKIAAHHAQPGRLYLQNHWGLYRTDDAGESWTDIANGVPSDFGFALAAHPHDPDTAYIVPIESDAFRCTPEGKLRVYRTKDAGKSWKPLTKGLPQKNALETILRDSLATDRHDPAGVYFGTRSGKVYGSADEGNSWRLLADGLPGVVCVKAATIESRRVIAVVLPGYLGEIVGGRGRVTLPGAPATVGEALAALVAVHPGLRDRIQDEQGVVRTHVNVFVGGVSIRDSGGLATPLAADAEIRVLPAVSGG